MTVYVFDQNKKVRAMPSNKQITDLIHDEANHSLTAVISSDVKVETGEYIGFLCADKHFRLFEINVAAHDDDRNITDVTATDAIVAELQEEIIEEVQQIDVTLRTALRTLLPGEEWEIVGEEPDRKEKSRAYYTSVWMMVETFAKLYEWRIIPYYRYDEGRISGKVLEMEPDEGIYRGRILQSRKDASKVYVTRKGRPITRMYGIGPATSSGDVQTNMTFSDAVWRKADGDPADKPKGQSWVEDPEAVNMHGIHAATVSITDAADTEDLLKKTWDELQKLKKPSVNVQATVADMEMVPGYSYMQIRLGDLVAVRLLTGESVEARVIGIKRNYIRPWLTTISIGDKKATITSQVSSLITNATHTFERLTIYKNRFHEDEALIQLNAEHIQLNATTIVEHAEQILLWAEETESIKVMLDGVTGELTAQAEAIRLNAEEISAVSKRIDLQADEIFLKAKTYVDELITEYATIEELTAQKAYVDNLVAQYATLSELEVLRGQVADLEAGLGTLTILNVGTINADETNTTFLNADLFTHAGAVVSQRAITMGDVSTTGRALSTGGVLDLQHSHEVTVNGDGTITLGEVSSSGGSFRIADTQYYKDGVSAAKDSVTIAAAGWVGGSNIVSASNGKSVTVSLPPFKTSGGTSWINNKTTVFFYTDSVSSPLQTVEVDATSVYEQGYAAGYGAGNEGVYEEGYEAGYQAACDAVSVVGGISSINNTAANYMHAIGWASARIGDVQLDYTTFNASQYFPNLGQ